MKIVVLCGRFSSGKDIIRDDFHLAMRLSEGLSKKSHHVIMICADNKLKESFSKKMHEIEVISIAFSPFRIIGYISLVLNKTKNADILISTSHPVWALFALMASKTYGKPFVYHIEDTWEIGSLFQKKIRSILAQIAIPRASSIACITETIGKKAKKLGAKNIHIVPQGVDLDIFKPLDQKECRKRLGLPQEKKIIIYTGSIAKNRGIAYLLDAYSMVREKLPEAILCLYGKVYADFEGCLDREGVYVGDLAQSDVAFAINASDVCVLPNSDNEFSRNCFPYKILEYMACDRPIVSTDIGVVSELFVEDGSCLCKPGSSKELAKKLCEKLEDGSKVSFRKKAMEFSWENATSKLEECVKSAVK